MSDCSGVPVVSNCGSETDEINTSATCIDPCVTTTSEPCTTDCCDNTALVAPKPYYECAPACEESHIQQIIQKQFYTTLKVFTAWNVPACGGQATVTLVDAQQVLPGSYLWNPTYGYFQVISFNSSTKEVVLQNNCNEGNADVGDQIPACTDFVVVDPPIVPGSGQTDIYPFLAIDFTAPANGNCIDITVTNVNGLSVGKNVSIGSGTYELTAILDATTITICNNGDGITPGTAVIAKNEAGEYQYPIILIDSNVCTNPDTTTGALLVCNNNVTRPLSGLVAGAVPVLQDASTNEVQFEILELPTRTCTALTADLTLVTGQASYTLTVADSSQFIVTDVVQIGSRSDRLTITAIPDSTHMQGTLAPVPGSIQNISAGTSVCLQGCCETVQDEIDSFVVITVGDTSDVGLQAINNGAPSFTGPTTSVTFTNTSPTKSMKILYTTHALLSVVNVSNSNSQQADFTAHLERNPDSGGWLAVGGTSLDTVRAINDTAIGLLTINLSYTDEGTLTPGQVHVVEFRPVVAINGTSGASVAGTAGTLVITRGIGVAV